MIETVIVLKNPYITKTASTGITMSNTAMSLLNLVMIRPMGLESKKRIFARSTFSVIYLCMLFELLKHIQKITNERPIVKIMKTRMLKPNIIG